jgi:NYN domain
MPLAHPSPGGPKTVEVIKTEEKGSDVNLASYLLMDGFLRDCDTAVVVTNDSDLAEPLSMARNQLGLMVGVINPHQKGHPSHELVRNAHFCKSVREATLRASQFPVVLRDQRGSFHKPPTW